MQEVECNGFDAASTNWVEHLSNANMLAEVILYVIL